MPTDNFGSFDEFEFKPLTEGLGFNKKADGLKNEIKSTMASAAVPPRSSIFPEARSAQEPTKMTDAPAAEKRATAPAFEATARSFGAEITKAPRPESPETTRAASQSISELMASLPPSLDFLDDKQDLTRKSEMPSFSAFSSAPAATPIAPLAPSSDLQRPQIFQPLGRGEAKSTLATGPTVGSVLPAPGTKAGSGVPTMAALAAPLVGAPAVAQATAASSAARSGYRDRMTETFNKTFPNAAPSTSTQAATDVSTEGLVPVAVNFSAGLIDAMVVAGISTILLVCIITITHINLVALLSNASTDTSTQKNLVFLFFAVLQMYMLVSRAFFGASLGEWAFDTQLGSDEQARSLTYPLQALWRTLFITMTGVVTLPLLSFAMGRDLGRTISGLQLYRRS